MGRKQPRREEKYKDFRNVEAETKANPPPKTDDIYIHRDEPDVAITREPLSTDEQELREARKRFKRLFGYKPVGLTTAEITTKIEAEEQRRNLLPLLK